MPILEFDCSICAKLYGKAKQRHGIRKTSELTLHEWFSTCLGCGAMGIKIVDEAKVEGLSL